MSFTSRIIINNLLDFYAENIQKLANI